MSRWRLLAATAIVGALINHATGWRVPGIVVSAAAVGLAFGAAARMRERKPAVDAWAWSPPMDPPGAFVTFDRLRDDLEARGFVVTFYQHPHCYGGAMAFIRLKGVPVVHETLDFMWDEVMNAWKTPTVEALLAVNRMLKEGTAIALSSP